MSAPHPDDIKAACEKLAEADPVLAAAYGVIGVPTWRSAPARFETLARTVTFQLISTRAADAIWARTQACLGGDVRPETLLDCEIDALRACGQSRPKIAHMRAIAQAVCDGELDFARLQAASVAEARRELLRVRGIGPWTADVFLLGALGQLDACPMGDVGILEAWRRLSGQEARPSPREFAGLAEAWQPFRGVAAHLLWGWLNHMRTPET